MPLIAIIPNQIWYAQQVLKSGPFAITSRMTVVRLQSGKLWIHSPIAPTPAIIAALDKLGSVQFVVAPNKVHHLHFLPFIQVFPYATGIIASGLKRKRLDLESYKTIDDAGIELTGSPSWTAELQAIFIEGIPTLQETAWFHQSSGTLILTDLLACFGSNNTGVNRLMARLLGVYENLAMSRMIKFLVKDKSALARSVKLLLALDVQRIVVSHDQIIEIDAKQKLEQAFRWLNL